MSLWRAAGVADVRAAATGSPVYGLPALLRLDQLPVVRPQTLAGGQSSFERNTHGPSSGNTDRNNFLEVARIDHSLVAAGRGGTGCGHETCRS